MTSLPWRRPRYELALLALVAVAALTPVYVLDAQDISRLCLTGALEHGHLSADTCLEWAADKSQFAGHLYTDKAPGMSAIELPAAELVHMRPNDLGDRDPKLWAVRVLSTGLAFLLCAFLVGRVGEGLAPGRGGATLVAFGLGTLVAPFAAANFGHVAAATLGFGSFLLAWKQRHLLAGLLAGVAVLVEYQAGGIAVILGAYVAARGLRQLLTYAAGVAPGVALLLVYNTLAFGAPWHLSYKYIANGYVFAQTRACSESSYRSSTAPMRSSPVQADCSSSRLCSWQQLGGSCCSGDRMGRRQQCVPLSRCSSSSSTAATSCRTAASRRDRDS